MGKEPKDILGARMKEFYENRAKTSLIRRMPVAIRIDGKAFHTFTKGFDKPFDKILMESMQETMLALCKNLQGCVLGYTQSDEITLILTDYKKLTSDAFFDYDVQKVCSITASMATKEFNKIFEKKVNKWSDNFFESWNRSKKDEKYNDVLMNAVNVGAMFDSRCFNIPKEEVANLVYWRQQDASKNSVSMAARAYFSHKEVHGKTTSQMQEMLFNVHGINWNDYPTDCKRGACAVRGEHGWEIDTEIPLFKGENRAYIENRINFVEQERLDEKVDKVSILKDRLTIIEQYVEEGIFNIARKSKDMFVVSWKPQYGEIFDMVAILQDDGELFYGVDEEGALSGEWFELTEDIEEGWTEEITNQVRFGNLEKLFEPNEEELENPSECNEEDKEM